MAAQASSVSLGPSIDSLLALAKGRPGDEIDFEGAANWYRSADQMEGAWQPRIKQAIDPARGFRKVIITKPRSKNGDVSSLQLAASKTEESSWQPRIKQAIDPAKSRRSKPTAWSPPLELPATKTKLDSWQPLVKQAIDPSSSLPKKTRQRSRARKLQKAKKEKDAWQAPIKQAIDPPAKGKLRRVEAFRRLPSINTDLLPTRPPIKELTTPPQGPRDAVTVKPSPAKRKLRQMRGSRDLKSLKDVHIPSPGLHMSFTQPNSADPPPREDSSLLQPSAPFFIWPTYVKYFSLKPNSSTLFAQVRSCPSTVNLAIPCTCPEDHSAPAALQNGIAADDDAESLLPGSQVKILKWCKIHDICYVCYEKDPELASPKIVRKVRSTQVMQQWKADY